MMGGLNYLWRMMATGLSFVVFGVGGLCIGVVVMPILMVLYRQREQRRLKAQYVIHRACRGFVNMMQCLGVMRLHVDGIERLDQPMPLLVLANHPTLIDVVCLLSIMPQADCIVKQALWRNPCTHGPLRAANYILNDQSEQLIEDSVTRLTHTNKIIVFPEGTRTVPEVSLNAFQRGSAHIAIQSGAHVLPIIIRCVPSTLSKHQAWYHIPARRFDVFLSLQDAIDVAPWRETEVSPTIQARRLNAYLHDYFLRKLAHE